MSNEQPRILIVEDEPDLLETLVYVVTRKGFATASASNGRAAMAIIDGQGAFDVILSDINMPEMNGFQLLGELRSREVETPFIFLTAHAEKESAVQALQLGALDVVDKPVRHENLVNLLGWAGQLGILMRTMKSELDEICSASDVSPTAMEAFRQRQRELILAKKMRAARLRPAG